MATSAITARQVSDWLGGVGTPADPDDPNLLLCVAAVNAMVAALPTAAKVTTEAGGEQWADQTVTGAIMLAARLVRRRNSPAGVEAFTDTGAAYVARYDPDIARMLRLDRFTPPQIG